MPRYCAAYALGPGGVAYCFVFLHRLQWSIAPVQAAGGLTPLHPPALLQNFAALGDTGDPAVALLHLVLDGINPRYCQNIRGVRINPLPFDLAWTHHSQAACRLHVNPSRAFVAEGEMAHVLLPNSSTDPNLTILCLRLLNMAAPFHVLGDPQNIIRKSVLRNSTECLNIK